MRPSSPARAAFASSSGGEIRNHRKRRDFMFAKPTVRTAFAVTLALGLILALPGAPATAQQPSPSAIATAKEVITVKGAAAVYAPLVPGVIEQAKGVFLQSNPMLSKDLNEVAAKLRADYAARSEELKDTLAFYKSPLGRKLLVEEPAVLDQSMRNAQTWANRFSEEVISKMRAEMKKRGHDI
jgi:uncharacterized protein